MGPQVGVGQSKYIGIYVVTGPPGGECSPNEYKFIG